jgi:hypothetical protein
VGNFAKKNWIETLLRSQEACFFFLAQFCDAAKVVNIQKLFFNIILAIYHKWVFFNSKKYFYILDYLLELIIKIWWFGNFIFLKSDKFGSFLWWKILCMGWKHTLQVKIWSKLANKKKVTQTGGLHE